MKDLKYYNTQIVFREFPEEITLAINITNCPRNCKGCHSPHLQDNIGNILNKPSLDMMIQKNPGITNVGFMGGDSNIYELCLLRDYIKEQYNLKVGWYTGKDSYEIFNNLYRVLNFFNTSKFFNDSKCFKFFTVFKHFQKSSKFFKVKKFSKIFIKTEFRNFDYIKYGPYKEELGAIDNINTNQVFLKLI